MSDESGQSTPTPSPAKSEFRAFGNPMLAARYFLPHKIIYPVYAQPKYDGYRLIVHGGKTFTRSLKPCPNKFVQRWAQKYAVNLEGLDGEIVVGEPHHPEVFKRTSAVRAVSGTPDFKWVVFDSWHCKGSFEKRWGYVHDRFLELRNTCTVEEFISLRMQISETVLIHNYEALMEYEATCIAKGYEGIVYRSPSGRYKNNRATETEGFLGKVKRYTDSEAVIKGFEPRYRNDNEAFTNELGRTKRSSHQDNMTPLDMLGAFVCDFMMVDKDGNQRTVEVKVGTGFDHAQATLWWERRDKLIGKVITIKWFAHGSDEAPRHPVFKGFRDKWDMSP